jgi:hypothetical protein
LQKRGSVKYHLQLKFYRRKNQKLNVIQEAVPAENHAILHFTQSSREAIKIANDQRLRLAYTRFYKTKAGKSFKTKSSKYFSNGNGDIEFHAPADLPQSSITDHPVNHIEPETENGFAEINVAELILIRDTFRTVFRWALDGEGLVEKGFRCNICIARMKKRLSRGLAIDKSLAKDFDRRFKPEALKITGLYYGRLLEWLRRGGPISARGERVDLLAYTLWPTLINASTLATLGSMNGKTRQAKDKLANCLRDTFSGIKALAMRNDITRERCRYSQLNK